MIILFNHDINVMILVCLQRTLTCEDSVNLPIHGSTTHGVIKFSILKHAQNGPVPPFQFQIQVSGAQGELRSSSVYDLILQQWPTTNLGLTISGRTVYRTSIRAVQINVMME